MLCCSVVFANDVSKKIFIKQIKIIGCTKLKKNELRKIITVYEKRELNFEDIKALTKKITQKYIENGYLTSKAYVPKQKILNNILIIKVFEGKVGKIIIKGSLKYYDKEFIKSYLNDIKSGEVYNQKKLEKSLLLLNELPKLKVKANLKKGEKAGTTDIVLTIKESILFSSEIEYNNFGSKYVSRNRYRVKLNYYNLLKQGSEFSLEGIRGDNIHDMKFGKVSYEIPIGQKGLAVGGYYATGNYDVGQELSVLDIKGKSDNFGFYAKYPIVKNRKNTFNISFSYDYSDAKQELLGTTTSRDRLRTVSLAFSYELLTLNSRNFLNFSITRGLGHLFGGMERDYNFSSRIGASNSFTKYNLNLMRLQRISKWLFFILKGSCQYSNDKLVSSHQYYVGGANTVRGFSSSEIGGDSGYLISLEVRVSPIIDSNVFQFALFIDNGGVYKHEPAAGEKLTQGITGAGCGIRLNLPYNFLIRVDVGVPINKAENSEGRKKMFYVQIKKIF